MPQTASGKTVADLILEARYDLNDYTAPYFAGDTIMLSWFNDARFAVARDGYAFQDSENIDLTTAVEYTPTKNYIDVFAVQYINADAEVKGLFPGSPDAVGHTDEVDEPTHWYEHDGKVGVYPALSSTSTQKVKVFEALLPTSTLALTDSVDSPAIFDTSLVTYIVAKHMWTDKKYASSAQAMAEFKKQMAQARLETMGTDK